MIAGSLKLKLLIAAVMAAGLLVLVPSGQSQVSPAPDLDKTASPNPATVGEELIFTITETNTTNEPVAGTFTDVFPSSLTFSGTFDSILNGTGAINCTFFPDTNTLEGSFAIDPGTTAGCLVGFIPTQPGTITNTVTDSFGNEASVTVCIRTPGGNECAPPQQQEACPPVSQDVAQEAESGDVELSGEAISEADNANQSVPALQFANSGNNQNAQGVVQSCSEAEDIQLEGGSITLSPELETGSDQTVGQAAADDGG